MSKTRHLIVGSGPVGMPVALGIKRTLGDKVSVELVDKRAQPGGRFEMLFLEESSVLTLPEDAQAYLFQPDEKQEARAFRAKNACFVTNDIRERPHSVVALNDLESALTRSVLARDIPIHRGLEFVSAAEGKATFHDVATGERVIKEYDELTLAIGLSGVHRYQAAHGAAPFEIPRLLHSFPVALALYQADFRDLDPGKDPTSIVYFTKDRIVGLFITPRSIGICASVPDSLKDGIDSPAAQLNVILQGLTDIPKPVQHLLKRVDLKQPESVKFVPAVATLMPTFYDAENHVYFAGDMLATFPYVWGSETNFAYNTQVPRLLTLFQQLQGCTPAERAKALAQYEDDMKESITNNRFFRFLLPYGENIRLGAASGSQWMHRLTHNTYFHALLPTLLSAAGTASKWLSTFSKLHNFLPRNPMGSMMSHYEFPGWDALAKAPPYTREEHQALLPIQGLRPAAPQRRVSVTTVGLYRAPSSGKPLSAAPEAPLSPSARPA